MRPKHPTQISIIINVQPFIINCGLSKDYILMTFLELKYKNRNANL